MNPSQTRFRSLIKGQPSCSPRRDGFLQITLENGQVAPLATSPPRILAGRGRRQEGSPTPVVLSLSLQQSLPAVLLSLHLLHQPRHQGFPALLFNLQLMLQLHQQSPPAVLLILQLPLQSCHRDRLSLQLTLPLCQQRLPVVLLLRNRSGRMCASGIRPRLMKNTEVKATQVFRSPRS